MQRFHVDRFEGKAITLIVDRIKNGEAYKRALEGVVTAVATATGGKTVEEMKAMGGMSAVVELAISVAISLDPEMRENKGSEMFPMTAGEVLRSWTAKGFIIGLVWDRFEEAKKADSALVPAGICKHGTRVPATSIGPDGVSDYCDDECFDERSRS